MLWLLLLLLLVVFVVIVVVVVVVVIVIVVVVVVCPVFEPRMRCRPADAAVFLCCFGETHCNTLLLLTKYSTT